MRPTYHGLVLLIAITKPRLYVHPLMQISKVQCFLSQDAAVEDPGLISGEQTSGATVRPLLCLSVAPFFRADIHIHFQNVTLSLLGELPADEKSPL